MGKSNKIKQILAVGIIVAVVLLAVTLYQNLPGLRKKAAVSRMPDNIDISLRTVTYSETRDGVKKWVLQAQQADVSQKDNNVYLTHPNFTVYLRQEPGTVTVTAGRAVYDLKRRDVTLTDKVVALSDSGMNVETGELFFDAVRSLLTTNDHVKVTHRNAIVEGDGMEFHTVNGTVRLLRNVSATLKPGGR